MDEPGNMPLIPPFILTEHIAKGEANSTQGNQQGPIAKVHIRLPYKSATA
jgi:hypothetical protein